MKFEKAIRKRAKLRLALTGPSGSGKTYGALIVAKGLGGKIAVIDSEHGSASLYSHLVDFDTLQLDPPYSPERYIAAIKAAEQAGYDVIVVDSTTHEWSGSGGCLEINEQTARAKFGGNTWSAWNDTTPRHRAFIDTMLQANAHVIATGRSKTETAQTEGPNGKKKVVKLGMKTEQRDGFEYEFTVVLDLIHDGHFATASKDRTGIFAGDPKPISEDIGKELQAWLADGAEPVHPIAMTGDDIARWIEHVTTSPDKVTWQARLSEASSACANDKSAHAAIETGIKAFVAALKAKAASTAKAET